MNLKLKTVKSIVLAILFILSIFTKSIACEILNVPIGTPVNKAVQIFDFLTKYSEENFQEGDAIKYKEYANFLNVNFGECLIFSPTLFHGNVLNQTEITRISINCRFKNLFSHEAKNGERRLGSFYRVLRLSPVTKLGLSYRDDLIKF